MLYSIIDTKKGEEYGLRPLTHQTLYKGERMIVNENELRKLGDDIVAVAEMLGGTVLTLGELQNIQKSQKHE